jgi:ABC-type multidrug transport system fused ATPase/permease subunit
MNAVRIRKTLIAAMYSKVSKLSMKSLTETNSGKLITIVSGDIQAIERPLAMIPIVFAAPLINLIAFLVLLFIIGWEYGLITIATWILIMIAQHFSSQATK